MLSSLLVLAVQVVPPIQQIGSCPLGYYGQAGYCIPTRKITPPTQSIIKTSSPCPLGTYTASSNYCTMYR